MEVKEILSKGVPTQLVLPMEISIIDLIKICKKTTNLEEQIKKAFVSTILLGQKP